MIVDKYKTDLPDSLKDTFAKDTSPLPDDDDTTLEEDRKSTRLNSSHASKSRMPSSA